MTMVVRPWLTTSSDRWMAASVSLSTALVASSNISTGRRRQQSKASFSTLPVPDLPTDMQALIVARVRAAGGKVVMRGKTKT